MLLVYNSMIDICTVVFRAELPILKVQAQSIGLNCQSIGVRNIYVVLNDAETLAAEIDPRWWGAMAPHVLVIPRTTFSTPWVEDGWLSQQLWKLLCASLSYNVYTMVLDAKTLVTNPMDLHTLCDNSGRLRVGRLAIPPVFEQSKNIACQLYDINVDEQLGPGGVPYFFHNDTVRFMISDTTVRTKQSFPDWFQRQGRLTEYILYSTYVKFKYGSHDVFYDATSSIVTVNLCHSQTAMADVLLAQMQNAATQYAGIHRRAWTALSPEQKQLYRNLLIDRGITSAWDLK